MKPISIYLILFCLIVFGNDLSAQDKKNQQNQSTKQVKASPAKEVPAKPVTSSQGQQKLPQPPVFVNPNVPISKVTVDTAAISKKNLEMKMKMKTKDAEDRKAYEAYQQQRRVEKENREREYERRMLLEKQQHEKQLLERELQEKKMREFQIKGDSVSKK